jgi:MFS family permease
LVGLGLNGFSAGMILTPVLPEIIESVYLKEKLVEGEDEIIDGIIADKASGLYNSFISLGIIVGPLIGSGVYALVGENWNLTCDIFAFLALVYTALFFFINVLPDIRKEKA